MTDFPTDAEREAAMTSRGMHFGLITTAEEILSALAPLIRAREAAAWDKGYMRGRFPFTHEGQDDPIPPGVGPAKFGSNANPYRQEADDDRD